MRHKTKHTGGFYRNLERHSGDKRQNMYAKKNEEKIMCNVRELILPYVAKLKTANLDFPQAVDIDIIEKHLMEIASTYLSRLPSGFAQFSPREMQVTTMIKNGLTTKEINSRSFLFFSK